MCTTWRRRFGKNSVDKCLHKTRIFNLTDNFSSNKNFLSKATFSWLWLKRIYELNLIMFQRHSWSLVSIKPQPFSHKIKLYILEEKFSDDTVTWKIRMKQGPMKSRIYEINCRDCNRKYIAQTRSMITVSRTPLVLNSAHSKTQVFQIFLKVTTCLTRVI